MMQVDRGLRIRHPRKFRPGKPSRGLADCADVISRCAVLSSVLVCFLSTPASGNEPVTEGKYFACRSTQWLDDFTSFAVHDETAKIQHYLEHKRCLLLKPNLPVTLAGDSTPLGPRAEFVIQGIRFYAPSEEIVQR